MKPLVKFVVRVRGWSLRIKAVQGAVKISHAVAMFPTRQEAEAKRNVLNRALES